MAISKFGNSKNQKLMAVGRNLAIGGLITAAGSGYAALAGMRYGDKQFKTEGDIYARVKRSTRV